VFPISQGNAEALDRWGGKTKHHMILYFPGNISAKNYHNRIVYVKIIARRRWDVFVRHSVQQSIASSLFSLHAWQSFCTTSVHVLFGLPLGLEPCTSFSVHFFTQSLSSFCNTCPYHRNLFCCSTKIILSIPNLSLSLTSLLGTLSFTLTSHTHLTILISSHGSATLFSFLTGQVSLPE